MGPPASQTAAFVGRERELGELRTAFDGAVNGNGRLVMVVGESGIGKTALGNQLAKYVQDQGGTTLIGHCYEEGSPSLPYPVRGGYAELRGLALRRRRKRVLCPQYQRPRLGNRA